MFETMLQALRQHDVLDAVINAAGTIIAAVLAAVAGVMTYVLNLRRDKERDRQEALLALEQERHLRQLRIRDCKLALRAEIRGHLPRWLYDDADGHAEQMAGMIRKGARRNPPFTPFVPRETPNPAFLAVAGEIQILPGDVIDSVILYYQQVDVISQLAQDMGSALYAQLDPERKIEVYRDYIALRVQAGVFARDAINALESSSDDE